MTVRKHGVTVENERFNTLGGDIYALINEAFQYWFEDLKKEGYTHQVISYDLSPDQGRPLTHTWIGLDVYLTPIEVELPAYDREELLTKGLEEFEADLLQEAKDMLKQVNEQLDDFLENCRKTKVTPTLVRNQRGGYVLLDMLLVKSNAVNTITMLKGQKT